MRFWKRLMSRIEQVHSWGDRRHSRKGRVLNKSLILLEFEVNAGLVGSAHWRIASL